MRSGIVGGLLFLIVVALIGGGVAWRVQQPTPIPSPTTVADTKTLLDEVKEVIAPPPLRRAIEQNSGQLTIAGVLSETNRHRGIAGLPALTGNTTLNRAAQNKLDDMFAGQYFDHVSPAGLGPSDVVDGVGYTYVRVGENLALGNFSDDGDLVQARMDSPGHRENILHTGFSELGVAVGQGQFEGRQTWLAVQTFGLPLSVCPTPDAGLQSTFDEKQATLISLSDGLTSRSDELSAEADALDALTAEINSLSGQGNAKIVEGNAAIEKGNEILQSTGDRTQAQSHWDAGEALQNEGKALLAQADAKQAEHASRVAAFNTKRETYNSDVSRQNALNEELQALVTQINQQITSFNSCLGEQ